MVECDGEPSAVGFRAADDDALSTRLFAVYETGTPLERGEWFYGTCPKRHGITWHLFEVPPATGTRQPRQRPER